MSYVYCLPFVPKETNNVLLSKFNRMKVIAEPSPTEAITAVVFEEKSYFQRLFVALPLVK